MNDPLIVRSLKRLDKEVVKPHILQNKATLSTTRDRSGRGYRTAPILRIAEELGLFDHLEKKEVREGLFPTYPDFRIARANETVSYTRGPDGCSDTLWMQTAIAASLSGEWNPGANHGGVRSRGYGDKDASN